MAGETPAPRLGLLAGGGAGGGVWSGGGLWGGRVGGNFGGGRFAEKLREARLELGAADVNGIDLAVAADENDEGNALDATLGGHGELRPVAVGDFVVEHDLAGDGDPGNVGSLEREELLDVAGLGVHVDADDFKTFGMELFEVLADVGHFFEAGAAPGGPEIDERNFAGISRPIERRAIDGDAFDREGLADQADAELGGGGDFFGLGGEAGVGRIGKALADQVVSRESRFVVAGGFQDVGDGLGLV